MVTKSARTQSRRTSTAGKIPSSSELLEGETFINMADKKMWFKDQSNVVQRIAGGGRGPNDFLQYESFLGSGPDVQGIGISAGARVWFRRIGTELVDSYTNVHMTRDIDADASGVGTTGVTSAILRLDQTIRKSGLNGFQWPFTAVVTYDPTDGLPGGAGEHVAIFGGANKKADASMWGANIGVRDEVANPTKGTIGTEITLVCVGGDPNSQRFGFHVACNSLDSTPGANEISYGFVLGGPKANVQFKRMIKLEGTTKIALDASDVTFEYGDVLIRANKGHKIQWGEAGSPFSAPLGQIAWQQSVGTFTLDGIPLVGSAFAGTAAALPGNPATYIKLQIDGAMVRIPCYGDS